MKNNIKRGIAVFGVCTMLLTLVGNVSRETIKAAEDLSNTRMNIREESNKIVHQGKDGDINWQITEDGCLILEGEGDWEGCGDTVVIVSPEEEKALPAWLDYYEDIVSAKVHIKGITNCSYLFDGLCNLQKVELTDLDTSKTTNMESMFRGCSSLTTIELGDFDTSQVEDMSGMFANCEELEKLDLHMFKTFSLIDMSNMFYGCKSLKQVDLTSFNTSNVKYMYGTFEKCESLENVDVTGFNTRNILSMDSMFYGCDSLKELDLSSFDCSSLKQRIGAFGGFRRLFSIEKIKTPRNLPEWLEDDDMSDYSLSFENTNVQEWKGSDGEKYTKFPLGMENSITITREVIEKNQFPKQGKILGLNWSIDDKGNLNIKGSGDYFDDDEIDVWDKKPWIHWYKEIKSCTVDIKGITNTSYMFSGLKKLEKINFVNFNTSKVTAMREMFSNCESLKQVDVSHFNTSMVEDMSEMFYGCKRLSALDVTSFDTKKVVDMSQMFYGCSSLENLNLKNFVTSEVKSLSRMFECCHNLKQLLLGNWNTKKVESISRAFSCCHRLTNLDMSGWNLSALGGYNPANNLFEGCVSLSQIKTPQNTKINIFLPEGTWQENGEGEKYTSLPLNLLNSILLKNSERTQYDWEKQEKQEYKISAFSQTGGTITPGGKVSVAEGETQKFTITADQGYSVGDVKVDGESVGAVSEYVFDDISSDHTIEAIFNKDSFIKMEVILEKGQTILLNTLITPNEAVDKLRKWSSSNINVASVKDGLVTAIGAGTAIITAESQDGSNVKLSCKLIVSKRTRQFTGTQSYSKKYGDEDFYLDAKLTDGDGALRYMSSNNDVAIVSDTGKVTLKGVGETTVTITAAESDDFKMAEFKIIIKVAADNVPKPTEKPNVTESPKPTDKPNIMESPKPTDEPNPTENPKQTDIPNSDYNPVKGTVLEDSKNVVAYKVLAQGETVAFYQANNKQATKIIIPATVTISGTTYNVTAISDNAFSGCKKLKSVTIGKNVTTIGNKAFYWCTSLKKISVPASVFKIGQKAFYGCKKLKSIIIKTKKLKRKSVGSQAFKGIYKKANIKVPKKQKKAYQKWLRKKGITKKMKIK